MKTKTIPILAALCTFSLGTVYAAPLKVTAIPWVQGQAQIPHPALNGLNTRLQAVIEGGDCATYEVHWDVNGDGEISFSEFKAMMVRALYCIYFFLGFISSL